MKHSTALAALLSALLGIDTVAGQEIIAREKAPSIHVSDLALDDTKYSILLDPNDGPETCGPGCKQNGFARLDPAFVSSIKASAGVAPFSLDEVQDSVVVKTTFFTSTTNRHVDHEADEDGTFRPVDEDDEVIFIPIEMRGEAHFDIDGASVPLEEGKLLKFSGRSPHRTVLASGSSVKLLGPFKLKTFTNVGCRVGSCDNCGSLSDCGNNDCAHNCSFCKQCPEPNPDFDWGSLLDGKKACQPKGTACNGFAYLKRIIAEPNYHTGTVVAPADGPVRKLWEPEGENWYWALENTPENCVLAPAGSAEEFNELKAEAAVLDGDDGLVYWIGVSKSNAAVQNDNNGYGSRAGYKNFDGGPANALCDQSVWLQGSEQDGQPNNNKYGGPAETRVALSFDDNPGQNGLLIDASPDELLGGALYKCCSDTVVFPTCDN